MTALIALTACGGNAQQEAAAPQPEPAVTPAAARTEPPAEPAAGPTIPARFIGVWDAEFGNCDPQSVLRLRIAANGVGFIENYGTVTRLTEAANGKVTLDLAMEGEAQA